MTNGRRLVLAFTFKLGQKQAQLRSAMETVKICSKCVGSTINAGSGFHGSSVLRLFNFQMLHLFLNTSVDRLECVNTCVHDIDQHISILVIDYRVSRSNSTMCR